MTAHGPDDGDDEPILHLQPFLCRSLQHAGHLPAAALAWRPWPATGGALPWTPIYRMRREASLHLSDGIFIPVTSFPFSTICGKGKSRLFFAFV